MPRQAIDYFETVMYKIVCMDLKIKDCYVGSTTDFRKRKNDHKTSCKTKNFKLYQFINSNGGWDNWDMIEIEKFPCMDSNEKRRRERYWMEELKAELNMRNSIISKDEVIENVKTNHFKNKEKIKDYQKEYKKKNEEKLKEYQKKYREEHK